MKKILFAAAILISANLFAAGKSTNEAGILLKFKQIKGDSVSHISTVDEETYINGYLNSKTQFINRTTTTVKETHEDDCATLYTHYMTTQNSLVNGASETLSWGEEDFVTIKRKSNGELSDSDNDSLPTVRSVPCFPQEPVKIGDTWQAEGSEVHDCKELFGMKDAINVPFTASYKYEKDEEINGIKLNVISVYYEFSQKSDGKDYYSTYYGTEGWAKQTIYWDSSKGDLDHYTEDFVIAMYDVAGNQYVFKGSSHGEVTEYKSVNDDTNVEKLQEVIEKNNLDNVSVTRGEKGLTISLENIQFEADSNILLPSEQEKLKKIGSILKDFSNDLLITGHCAERGTVSARQKLSEERAQTVAQFLITNGIRDEYHIFTQGKGSTQPVASNDTEEGRARNRRVEITIMD